MNRVDYLRLKYGWASGDVDVVTPPESDDDGGPSSPTEAIIAESDLRAKAAGFLGLPELRHLPGQHAQKSHGHGGGSGGLTGQAALDAAPATLTPSASGHQGDYEGAELAGPAGMGSAQALAEYEGLEYQQTNEVLRGNFERKRDKWTTDEQWARQQEFVAERKAEVGARVAEIDKTMAVSKLTSDVQVHRVVKDGKAVFGSDAWYGDVLDWNDFDHGTDRWEAGERPNLTGLKFVDKGYVSTTAATSGAAKEFGKRWPGINSTFEGEPVIMSMHVPRGVGGIQLSDMRPSLPTAGKSGTVDWSTLQGGHAEILLQRGLTMEVTADHGVDADGFRQLDIEVSK